MKNIDQSYQELLQRILTEGKPKGDRTGTGTLSIFDHRIEYDMSNGFPLLTTKKMAVKSIITELLWFLSGDTQLRTLLEQGNTIWLGDAYKRYTQSVMRPKKQDNKWLKVVNPDKMSAHSRTYYTQYDINEFAEMVLTDDEFAEKWGDLGPIYGKMWRNWSGERLWNKSLGGRYDQIQNAIDLLRNDPDSRRIIVSSWNVEKLGAMTLPPCHWAFEFYTEELSILERYALWFQNNFETGMEFDPTNLPNFDDPYYDPTPSRRLSLKWHQRSVDTLLGLPFNIASYAFLLEMVAQQVNMVPGKLVGDLTNVHLYTNHIKYAEEQLGRDPKKFTPPVLSLDKAKDLFSYKLEDFRFTRYKAYPNWTGEDKPPLSN